MSLKYEPASVPQVEVLHRDEPIMIAKRGDLIGENAILGLNPQPCERERAGVCVGERERESQRKTDDRGVRVCERESQRERERVFARRGDLIGENAILGHLSLFLSSLLLSSLELSDTKVYEP